MAAVCPACMIFVPSVGGISHNVEEYTAPSDLVAGADVLLRLVLELDGEVGPARERPSAQTMAELRAQFAPKQRPLDALRDKMTKARPKTREERLAEIPW